MSKRLLWILLAWIVGVILGSTGVNAWVPVFVSSVVGVIVFLQVRHPQIPVLIGMLVLLGFGYGQWRSAKIPHSTCPPANQSAQVVVVDRPQIEHDRVRYVVKDASGCIILVYASRWPIFSVGDQLLLEQGKYQLVRDLPEDLVGFAQYLERRGIGAIWSFVSIQPLSSDSNVNAFSLVRFYIKRLFLEPDSSFVTALLLADRDGIPERTLEQFRLVGVSHVLAISGLHISLIAAVLWFFVGLLPFKPATQSVLLLALLWGYILFIGAPVSAMRAGLFWSVFIFSLRLGLLVSLPTALITAVTIFLTARPAMIWDVGLQLSISAVCGIFLILFLTRPYMGRLVHLYTGLASKIGLWLLQMLLVSAGAMAGTWPLVAYHFGIFSPIALVANVLIVPLIPFLLLGSAMALGISLIAFPVGVFISLPIHWMIVWLVFVADVLASVPGSHFAVSLSVRQVLLYYVALIGASMYILHLQRRRWREVWG